MLVTTRESEWFVPLTVIWDWRSTMAENSTTNHLIGFTATAAKASIITGDPDRVAVIADLLGTTTSRGSRRGFTWQVLEELDPPLMVCSTGIGSPSAAIVVEELADIGIRAGVLATEMEAAALFVVGGLRGLQCGAALIPADPETDPAALRRALASAVELGLHALRAAG
jgi:uridine phosphorylase